MNAKRFFLALINAVSLFLAGLVVSGNEVVFRESNYCSTSKQASGLLFVSTLDGELTALEESTGRVAWTIPSSGPLLSSSLSAIKNPADLKNSHYVPSLDGKLFQWHGDRVEALPMTASLLLGKTFQGPDGMQIAGSNDLLTYGIDPRTGQMRYICSTTGCKKTGEPVAHLAERQLLVLRRNQQTVRSFDSRTGAEKWNFSVGSYDIEVINGVDNHVYSSNHHCSGNTASHDAYTFRFDIPNGEIFGHDASGTIKWNSKMKTPIAASWRLTNNTLLPLDLFEEDPLHHIAEDNDDNLMYLGIYEGQMYIHSPEPTSHIKLTENPSEGKDSHGTDIATIDQPYVGSWRPYVSSSPSRTPFLNNERGVSAFNSLDYPFDNGFYILNNVNSKALQVLPKTTKPFDNKKDRITDSINGSPKVVKDSGADKNGKVFITESDNETDLNGMELTLIPLSLVDWWKEILVVSVVISIMTNLIVRWARKKLAECREQVNELLQDSTEARKRTGTVTTTVSTTTDVPRTLSISSSTSPSASAVSLSRYNSEFEHVQCLGKGGFGVVFRAKNKVDDCEYAVKRICLPDCSFAKEKVMREVKALARLDHPGIVRYFNSWWEMPSEHTQHTDREALEYFNSTALSHDWYVEVQDTAESKGGTLSADCSNGMLIMKDRNRQSSSTISHRSIGQDPLGKRFNIQTGTEDDLEDARSVDLLAHNDVFESDEDSFSVEFANSATGNSDDISMIEDASLESSDRQMTRSYFCNCEEKLTWSTLSSGPCAKCSELHFESRSRTHDSRKTNTKVKIVGRCCEKTVDCLKADPLHLYIQMQLCRKDTLKEWLSETCGKRTRQQAFDVFNQIVLAVEYVHLQGMMHRDLKPKNIFFTMDYAVKVGDFGLVTAVMRPSDGQSKGALPGDGHTGKVGTELYMSPEQVSGKPYNHKVDVYSLGLILFELLLSFSTDMERITNLLLVRQGRLPEDFERKCPKEAALIKWLINEDPQKRPEASEIKNNNLFTGKDLIVFR